MKKTTVKVLTPTGEQWVVGASKVEGGSLRVSGAAGLLRQLLLGWCLCMLLPSGFAADDAFDGLIAASERQDGFVPLYWQVDEGRLYAEIDQLERPFIYYPSLSQGVGSNDLGLDRGRLGQTQWVKFERVGPRLLLVALNTKYRASSDNADERRAVEEAFARSVLWGFDIAAAVSYTHLTLPTICSV